MASTISDSGITFSNTAAAPQLQSIGATVAANAMTVTLAPTTLVFRSTTLGSGTPTVAQNATQLSLTIPSSATLGTVNAVQSRIIVLAILVTNTIELAVVNLSGGNDLTETGLISTTGISALSTSASTIYSANARASVPYRVVGYVDSTQATAGVWATAPSTVQSVGGQALTALSSLGYGQTWQSVTRSLGTTYYNTTGKPITFAFLGNTNAAGGAYAYMTMNGVNVAFANCYSGGGGYPFAGSVVIPAGVSYVFNQAITAGAPTISNTYELR